MTISKDVCPDSERYLLDRVAQGCGQSHTLRRFVYRVPLEAVEGRTTYVHSNSCLHSSILSSQVTPMPSPPSIRLGG